MKTSWILRIALAFGALLVLLIAVAAYLIATFDADSYKAQAIDWMKTERQRDLAIDGPIRLSVFPRLAVKITGVRLSERNSDKTFAAVDEAALVVQVMPLLKKRLIVDSVKARGVQLNYKRDANGVRNFDDLLPAAGSESGSTAGEENASNPLSLDVSALDLENLQLKVDDELADSHAEITLQSFKSGRIADRVESPVSLQAVIAVKKPQAIRLTLDGSAKLTPDLQGQGVALKDLKIKVNGDTAAAKDLSVALEGALAWTGSELRAGPLKISLAGAKVATITMSPSTVRLERLLFDPKQQKIEIEALAAALAGTLAGDAFDVSLDWPKLAVDGEKLQGSALSGSYKLAGATALAGSFKSAAPSGNFELVRLPDLRLELAGNAGPRKVDGTLRTDATLRFASKSVALEKLELNADLTEPSLQALKLGLRGSIDADPSAASWDLDGSLNSNKFESKGRAALSGKTPDITASARFDSLDLNTLLAADKAQPAAAPTAPASADTPVDLDGLRAVNGKFKFSAGKFVFRQYSVADARIDAALDDGSLQISRLTGRTWGGKIDASGSAAAGSGRVGVKLDAQGVDINALLKDVADKDLLEGKGRVVADISSAGKTVGSIRSNLAGTASLQLRDGAIKGINLARSLRQAKAALSMKQDAVSKANQDEKTDFSELNVSARLKDGVAHSDDLELKSPFLRLGGAGSFDIGRGRIDYTARTTVTSSAAGQDGADLSALRGVTIPVLLSGPFDAIDWKIQWSEVATAALKNTIKDKLTEKLGAKLGIAAPAAAAGSAPQPVKPKDILKDKLKGLFK